MGGGIEVDMMGSWIGWIDSVDDVSGDHHLGLFPQQDKNVWIWVWILHAITDRYI
jgi:hypothetical protein